MAAETSGALVAWVLLASLSVLAFTIWLVWYYCRHDTPIVVKFTVGLSWFISFCALSFLLPLDLLAGHSLVTLWDGIYWFTFLLTWLVIPIQQEYSLAGDFTFKERMKSSLRANLKFYGVFGILFFIFLIYIGIRNDFGPREMLGFCICMSNLWGLCLLVLLLGYGLVELPRFLWYRGIRYLRLKKLQYRAADVYNQFDDAKDQAQLCVRLIENYAAQIPETSPLREFLGIIEMHAPLQENEAGSHRVNASSLALAEEDISTVVLDAAKGKRDIGLKELAALHHQIKTCQHNLLVSESEWQEIVEKSIELEELIASEQQFESSPGLQITLWCRIRASPLLSRALAVFLALLSGFVLWSEITMFASVNISLFAVWSESVQHHKVALQFLSMIPLVYISVCVCFSLFRLRLFKYYHMHHSHRTDENSMLFNAAYMLRLVAPIGFNFFRLIRWEETSFGHVVGRMDAVPFLGEQLNYYIPVLTLLFCAATLFDFFGKILRILGFEKFEYKENYASDYIAEGRMLINKEKRNRGYHENVGGLLDSEDNPFPETELV